ncbi:hypothetical protein GC194_09155 [bacterium]|nr:hypothetical protein [bacterium]
MKLTLFPAIAITVIVFCGCRSQKNEAAANSLQDYNIGFYNVENLFDTINDPGIDDEEFLPQAEKKYNSTRYNEKLAHLAQVIATFNPAVLGLCEVENEAVLNDLAAELLKVHNIQFAVAHHNSPDKRGIDVAFLYQAQMVQVYQLKWFAVAMEGESDFATRDIMRLTFCLKNTNENTDSLYLFANHWPSRSGGQEASEPRRIAAAKVLKHQVDKLQGRNSKAKIIIMGDFNDEPFNTSMVNYLKADTVLTAQSALFNLSYALVKKGQGSYNYRGQWNVLDQIIVSCNLLEPNNRVQIQPAEAQVVKHDFMLYETRSGEKVPSRSYGGPNYYGGYSDHLPVFATLQVRY